MFKVSEVMYTPVTVPKLKLHCTFFTAAASAINADVNTTSTTTTTTTAAAALLLLLLGSENQVHVLPAEKGTANWPSIIMNFYLPPCPRMFSRSKSSKLTGPCPRCSAVTKYHNYRYDLGTFILHMIIIIYTLKHMIYYLNSVFTVIWEKRHLKWQSPSQSVKLLSTQLSCKLMKYCCVCVYSNVLGGIGFTVAV
jgi:hypothetical protein